MKWILSHSLRRNAFYDDKSGGFDHNASHLLNAQRLDRLLLVITVATLSVYELVEQFLRVDRRGEIDPGYHRQLSVFSGGGGCAGP